MNKEENRHTHTQKKKKKKKKKEGKKILRFYAVISSAGGIPFQPGDTFSNTK